MAALPGLTSTSLTKEWTKALVIGVNYYCRCASIILAG